MELEEDSLGENAERGFSLADLEEEALQVDEDIAVMQEMLEQMQAAGYSNLEEASYDDLEALQKRQHLLEENGCDASGFVDEVKRLYNEIFTQLYSTVATLQATREYKSDNFLRQTTVNAPDYIEKRVNYLIIDLLNEKLSAGEEVDTNEIVGMVMNSPGVDKARLDMNYSGVVRYIETLKPIIQSTLGRDGSALRQQSKKRIVVAKQLLRKEREQVERISRAQKCCYVKQIFQTGENEYYTVCPECGEKIPLDKSLVTIIAFPTEKGGFIRVLPNYVGCKNGHAVVLLGTEYLSILKHFINQSEGGTKIGTSINGFVRESQVFCKGASLLRVEPMNSEVMQSIAFLITLKTSESEGSTGEVKTSGQYVFVPDDAEYARAVKEFYKRLIVVGAQFSGTENNGESTATQIDATKVDKLSWQQLAVYMAQCLSLDYESERNRAVFSLLYYLNENPYFRGVLNQEMLWQYENYLALVENTKSDFRRLAPDVFAELQSWFNSTGFGEPVIGNTDEERVKLQQRIGESIPLLRTRVAEMKQERDDAFNALKEWEEELSFCKVLKLSNYKLQSLNAFLFSNEFLEFLLRVADRMLIVNHAGDFCSYWENLRLVSKRTIEDCTTVTAMLRTAEEKIRGHLKTHLGLNIPKDWFHSCFSADMSTLTRMQEVYNAFSRFDLYEFCSEVAALPASVSIWDSVEYRLKFREFQQSVARMHSSMLGKSRLEFYLRDFSNDEITDLDADKVVEGRYVLKREGDETFSEYAERYAEVKKNNKFSDANSYDKAKLFEPLKQWEALIAALPLRADTEFDAYVKSMFMVRLIDYVMQTSDRLDSMRVFGMTPETLAMINNKIKRMQTAKPEIGAGATIAHVFEGVYFSSVRDRINTLREQYSNMTVKASQALALQIGLFNPYREIAQLLGEDYFETTEEGEPVYDMDDVRYEILLYGGNDKKLAEVVE